MEDSPAVLWPFPGEDWACPPCHFSWSLVTGPSRKGWASSSWEHVSLIAIWTLTAICYFKMVYQGRVNCFWKTTKQSWRQFFSNSHCLYGKQAYTIFKKIKILCWFVSKLWKTTFHSLPDSCFYLINEDLSSLSINLFILLKQKECPLAPYNVQNSDFSVTADIKMRQRLVGVFPAHVLRAGRYWRSLHHSLVVANQRASAPSPSQGTSSKY